MKKQLQERIVLAALKALKKDDPFIAIGVGDGEVRIIWRQRPVVDDNSC